MRHAILVFAATAAFATPTVAQVPFALEPVTDALDQPVFLTAPAGDPRLFVVEQPGRIRIIADGTLAERPFLDISDLTRAAGERGLLGLAFHPDYAGNGQFFVNYTDLDGDTQIVRYTVSTDPGFADPGTASVVLSVDQPFGNHNGGWLGFGPDGQLYVGMGDGGSGGDPNGNGQNDAALLGKILRIDVDRGGEPEVFAKGLRNPWRNAFDGSDFYIADVGQGQWEEVSVIGADAAGANLGWNIMEGPECFAASSCDQAGLVLPIASYSHGEGGCSITGGYVYRGEAIPAIDGVYFYADFCMGVLQSLRYVDGEATEGMSYADSFGVLGQVTSFGLDGVGELYVMTQGGELLKFVPSS